MKQVHRVGKLARTIVVRLIEHTKILLLSRQLLGLLIVERDALPVEVLGFFPNREDAGLLLEKVLVSAADSKCVGRGDSQVSQEEPPE